MVSTDALGSNDLHDVNIFVFAWGQGSEGKGEGVREGHKQRKKKESNG